MQFFWSRKKKIAETEDKFGRIWVEQKGKIRFLIFGEDAEQSAVCMRAPLQLQYEYSRAMLLGGLCHPEPETALFLGLGSGALVRSCLAAMPSLFDAEIVELRPEVVKMAQQHMGFSLDERMTLRLGDARQLLPTAEQADLIFLDLYDENGPSRAHVTWEFLSHCQTKLADNGWLIINQWMLPDHKPLGASLLRGVFQRYYWELPVSEGNVILWVPASTEQNLPVTQLREYATTVGVQQGYDLLPLLDSIRLATV